MDRPTFYNISVDLRWLAKKILGNIPDVPKLSDRLKSRSEPHLDIGGCWPGTVVPHWQDTTKNVRPGGASNQKPWRSSTTNITGQEFVSGNRQDGMDRRRFSDITSMCASRLPRIPSLSMPFQPAPTLDRRLRKMAASAAKSGKKLPSPMDIRSAEFQRSNFYKRVPSCPEARLSTPQTNVEDEKTTHDGYLEPRKCGQCHNETF